MDKISFFAAFLKILMMTYFLKKELQKLKRSSCLAMINLFMIDVALKENSLIDENKDITIVCKGSCKESLSFDVHLA